MCSQFACASGYIITLVASNCPTYVQGDGKDPTGSTSNEYTAGFFENPVDCINACIEKAEEDSKFNGVTIRQDNKCRCKRTVVSTDGSSAYKTCVFRKSLHE